MNYYIRLFTIIIISLISISITPSKADKCFDYILLDGGETLNTFGMDTTQHWWAITQPFADSYRLIIDGNQTDVYKDFKNLTFSPDGNRWACFAKDNVQWFLLTDRGYLKLPNILRIGEIAFSPNSQVLAYSYYETDNETIVIKDRTIKVYQRASKLFLSNNGEKFAFVGRRSANSYVVNINGKETSLFDNVKPFGFWYNGQFLYAGQNGDGWEIFKNNEPISEVYAYIQEGIINIKGTVAGILANEMNGNGVGIVLSDQYYEPLIGEEYDNVSHLILHPELAMIAYDARLNGQPVVVLNSTEYAGGIDLTGQPYFTADGEDLYFLGCDIDCFINVNGQKFSLNTDLPMDRFYAKKSGSNTIAYATSSSMIIRDLESNELYAGMMVDQIIAPRYNWREHRYETLGSIGNRLYLLTCNF